MLLQNARGPFQGLPRTAGWGYPEPYTRDLMISALGILATGNHELVDALRRTLLALATHQTPQGPIFIPGARPWLSWRQRHHAAISPPFFEYIRGVCREKSPAH